MEKHISTRSLDYARAMGIGWNLGNSFDAVGDNGNNEVTVDYTTPDRGTQSWGNPVPTRDLIRAIHAKGFSTIRIPMTLLRRFRIEKSMSIENATNSTERFIIDPGWLKAYRTVVDWALAEGMHVVINIHHDSWLWLSRWHGDTSAKEYRAFCDFWDQIAKTFADEPDELSFETINEPRFVDQQGVKIEDDSITQPFMDALNKAAYEHIRCVPGNEKRMIIVTTLDTSFDPHSRLAALRDFIHADLHDDPNVIATVHYYSEWVYSGSLGRTGFDEQFRASSPDTPRTHLRRLADALDTYFTNNGIGSFIGEWGLLGYDTASDGALQAGEELKYYGEFLTMIRERGFACAFWDNGTGIDRTDSAHRYPWKKPLIGAIMQEGFTGRSAYATGLDTLFVEDADADRSVPFAVTLNGRKLTQISDGNGVLHEGTDYQVSSATTGADQVEITLSNSYVHSVLMAKGTYGLLADVTLTFDGGAPWHEYLVHVGNPALNRLPLASCDGDNSASGSEKVSTISFDNVSISDSIDDDRAAETFHAQQPTPAFWKPIVGSVKNGITVPLLFNSNELKSVAARLERVGVTGTADDPQSLWLGPQASYWDMLQNGGSFTVSYDSPDRLTGSLTLLPSFFDGNKLRQLAPGAFVLFCRFQSGRVMRIQLWLDADGTVRCAEKAGK